MKRIVSYVLAFFLALTVITPLSVSEASAAFKVRTSMPSFSSAAGKAYYYTDNNPFYKNNYGPDKVYYKSRGGYIVGNCTWYAYARGSEILGKPLNSNLCWGADNWYSVNKKYNIYPYGSKPKAGAIACYSNHVAVVEKVVDGKPYVSESSYSFSKKCPTKASDLWFHYGSPYGKNLKGYIYITDTVSIESKKVDFSVKITAKDLNLRAGPGVTYSRIGYVKPGTYKVTHQCGDWVKLASNGYWVCSSYVKKIENKSSTTSSTSNFKPYKVKISSNALNVRKGPSTSYAIVSKTKKGTIHEIKAEKNGWGQIKSNGYWIKLSYTKKVTSTTTKSTTSSSEYKVKVTAKDLNMRTGPGTSYKSKGYIKPGTYTISKTSNGWGKLKTNGYWIKLSYTKKVTSTTTKSTTTSSEYKVKVKAKDLNMRTGPATSYKSKGYIKPGTYTISKTSNGWGKLKTNGYWIKLSYTTKI